MKKKKNQPPLPPYGDLRDLIVKLRNKNCISEQAAVDLARQLMTHTADVRRELARHISLCLVNKKISEKEATNYLKTLALPE